MSSIFIVLFLLSLACFVAGLVRPSIFKLKSRKQSCSIFGIASVVFFVLIALTASTKPQSSQPAAADSTSSVATTAHQALDAAPTSSVEDQLKTLVANVLNGTTNMSHENRLKGVDVVKQIDGGWGVFVEFNADDNLSANFTKKGIEKQMSDVYTALYTSNKDVRTASAAAYLSLTDKYGNTSDQMVYKSILDKAVAGKVNWSTDKASLELQILPGLWSTTILSPALK